MTTDLDLARRIRAWIDRSAVDADALTASIGGHLDAEVLRVFPDARQFGEATVRAATRRVPAGVCRYCMADADARIHRTTQPRFDAATRVLLGPPCRTCMGQRIRSGTVQAPRPTVGAVSHSRRAVILSHGAAAAGVGVRHTIPCATCYAARSGDRAALVAAATPHRRVLAPTGRVVPVVHNGRGAQAACNCTECRGARIIAARERGVL